MKKYSSFFEIAMPKMIELSLPSKASFSSYKDQSLNKLYMKGGPASTRVEVIAIKPLALLQIVEASLFVQTIRVEWNLLR